MKRLLSILLILLTLTTLVSCTDEADLSVPEGMQEISNDKVNYRLYVPADWIPETETGVITAKRSDSILVNISMMAVTAPEDVTDVASYWTQFTDDFKSALGEFELIEENSPTVLGGYEAGKYVYTGTVGGANAAKYQQIICLKEGVIYIFTYTADPEKYDEYLPDVEQMLENFSFKD